MVADKLVMSFLRRFSRLIVPEMTSPKDSFWGGEKDTILNVPVEIARVNLDIPSFFTVEINFSGANIPIANLGNANLRIEVGVGRSMLVRVVNIAQIQSGVVTDPLFQFSFDDTSGTSPFRVRFTVWGTSLRIEATALEAAAVRTFRTTVTPGAGPITSAFIVGTTSSFQAEQNANTATVTTVAQNAASVAIRAAAAGFQGTHGLFIYNDAAADLFLRDSSDGVAAGLADYTRRIPPFTNWEMPAPFYTGLINGIWAAAGGGFARITGWRRV